MVFNKNYNVKEAANDIGNIENQTINSLSEIEKYIKNPEILDSEEALIKVYINEYKVNGKESARLAVDKRIKLANRFRELKIN